MRRRRRQRLRAALIAKATEQFNLFDGDTDDEENEYFPQAFARDEVGGSSAQCSGYSAVPLRSAARPAEDYAGEVAGCSVAEIKEEELLDMSVMLLDESAMETGEDTQHKSDEECKCLTAQIDQECDEARLNEELDGKQGEPGGDANGGAAAGDGDGGAAAGDGDAPLAGKSQVRHEDPMSKIAMKHEDLKSEPEPALNLESMLKWETDEARDTDGSRHSQIHEDESKAKKEPVSELVLKPAVERMHDELPEAEVRRHGQESARAALELSEDEHWQYVDTMGKVQGPFTAGQMRRWHELDFFDCNLLIRKVGQHSFSEISNFFPARAQAFAEHSEYTFTEVELELMSGLKHLKNSKGEDSAMRFFLKVKAGLREELAPLVLAKMADEFAAIGKVTKSVNAVSLAVTIRKIMLVLGLGARRVHDWSA